VSVNDGRRFIKVGSLVEYATPRANGMNRTGLVRGVRGLRLGDPPFWADVYFTDKPNLLITCKLANLNLLSE